MDALIKVERQFFAECPACGNLHEVEIYSNGEIVCDALTWLDVPCREEFTYFCQPDFAEDL